MSSSASEPMKTECEHHEECMKMIQQIIDGVASEEQIAHFKEHNLKTCMPCIEDYSMQLQVRKLITEKIEKRCCPQQIAQTIKNKIGIISSIIGLHIFLSHIFR